MASIRNCIKTLKKSGELSEDIAQQVQAAVAQHIKDGYSAKDAAREAVDDVLSDLRLELSDVYAQIGLTAEGVVGNTATDDSMDAPVSEPAKPDEYGASNKFVTTEDANAARALLRSKMNQLNVGIDPEAIAAGIKLAIYHIEAGARSFASYSQAMIADLGEKAGPYLREWYEAARQEHHLDGMTAADEIDSGSKPASVPLPPGRFVADQSLNIVKRGRKWFEAKPDGKNYTVKAEINSASDAWEIGSRQTFPAMVDVQSSKYGATTTIYPLTKDQAAAASAKAVEPEILRWLAFVEDKAPDYVYQNGVDKLHALGINRFPALDARLKAAIESVKAAKDAKEIKKAEVRAAEAARPKHYLSVPYEEKDVAKRDGARWDSVARSWYVLGDVPQSLEKYLPGHERKLPEGQFWISQGEGYGGREYRVGETIKNPNDTGSEYVTVVEAKRRYFKYDGMSFGVGDEHGYVYSAIVRPATEEESAPNRELARLAMRRKDAERELASLKRDVMGLGERPKVADVSGEQLGDGPNIYGGGEWWVIQPDAIWFVRNNGMDGDNWSNNNVGGTGGAGAIGWQVPFDADLADKLRKLHETLNGSANGAVLESRAQTLPNSDDRTGKTRQASTITGETPASIRAGLHQSIGKAVIDRLEQKGLLRIIKTADDLPHGRTISETGTALYDGNVAYLIADRMHPETAVREALHEIGEHHGLEGMLGKDGYAALVRRVRSMERFGNKRVRDAFATVRDLYPAYAENSAEFMHEVLANIGQDADIQAKPWWQEMLAAVKRWIVQLGYGGLIRAGDIQDMVLHSLKVAAGKNQFEESRGMVPAIVAEWRGARMFKVFRPEQIKSATSNTGEFSNANPDILESRQPRQQALPNTGATPPAPPTRQTPMGLQGGATGNNASWNGYQASKLDDVIRTLQDKHIDSKRTVQAIKAAGRQVADKWDVYLQETLFHGRAAKRTLDFVETELTPLAQDLAMRGLTLDELDQYLHARHAEEANALIAQRNPAIPDGGSGMTNQQAHDYFANLDPSKRKRLKASAARVDAIIDRTRQLYVSYGLESQETIDGWSDTFKHYVPLMREDKDGAMGIGQGFSIKGKESKSRTGSTRAVVDIMANIAMQRERAIVRGEKNRVSVSLLGLAKLNPNPDFWMTDRIPMITGLNPATGLVETYPDPIYKIRENVVVAKVPDGKGGIQERAVVFNDENELAMNMARALKNLDAAQLEGLMGAASRVTRYFASINTQYNPVFGVTNLVRDVQDAMLNLTSTPIAGHKADVLKHTLSALRGIYIDTRQMRKGQPATSAYAQLWEEFQHEGGQTGYRDMFRTSADRARAIEKAIDPMKWMDSTLGQIFTAGGALRVPMAVAQQKATWLFDWLSDYNESMENAVRLAAYKVGLEQGMSKQQAAAMAKSLTVNFNRKGQIGMQAGALYAFFNASMQGTGRIAQTLFTIQGNDIKTIRLSKAGQKIVAGGILLGSMQALMLLAAGFDDDEPPEFVRERNTIIPIGNKKYITIPMPLGFAVLPNIGRIATEFVMGGFKSPAKHVTRLLGIMADAFNPVGGNGTVLQMVTPTALDPLAAIAENKDWTKKPIAKVAYDKTTPGHRLWKDTASTPGKLIAEAINTMSGGTKYVAGSLSPTPDQIDYLFGQVTGGVGRELSKLEQSAAAAYRGEDLPPHKIPLVGRFYGDANAQSSQSTTFYNNINRINEYEAQINGLRKDGKGAEAAKFIAENPEARMVMRANYAERQVQKLRKEKHDLVEKDAPRERIKAIEDRIKAEMQRFNDAVKASKQREKEAA